MTTLSESTINWAIDHLSKYTDTDIFPKLFEFDAIFSSKDKVKEWLLKQDICQWTVRPSRKCLVPKQRFGFRIATQLDPLDMLLYMGIILEVAEEIEKYRLPITNNIAFSSRYKRDDTNLQLFTPDIGYSEFQQYSRSLCDKYEYIVSTDIADYYPRIYLHRLDNSLDAALPKLPSHKTAIMRLLKGWNQNVSYGIPVGNNPSRLLAELNLDDVDRMLLSEDICFCRFMDDYRIFCHSIEESYKCLSLLATILFDMHGLTLQAQKTKIIPSKVYISNVLENEERRELERLSNEFRSIMSRIGLEDPYEVIDFDQLPEEIQKKIEGLNLLELFRETILVSEYDISMARFIINRWAWQRNLEPLELILSKLDHLYPNFSEIIRYFSNIGSVLDINGRNRIGETLLNKLDGSVVGQLEFHRMLIMGLFAGSNKWGCADKLPGYYFTARDNWLKRNIQMALGKCGKDYWFRAQKQNFEQMSPWEKRSFLYAASCLPKDELSHWYGAIKPRLDNLEIYIINWASANPINT
jgi:hypothetical protein